jgi:hypothetical protein
MRTTLRALLLLGAATLTVSPMRGQQTAAAPSDLRSHAAQEVDLAFTYAPMRSDLTNTTPFWSQGGGFELSAGFYHGLGIAMDINGSHAGNAGGSGVSLNIVNTTFGPRYTWAPHLQRYSVFGQGLIGESHGFDSIFIDPAGAQTSANSFALEVGGGFDFNLSRHLALRPIEANWLRTQFTNGRSNVQNNLRLGAGVVLRLR